MTRHRVLFAALIGLTLATVGVLLAPVTVAEWVVKWRFPDVARASSAELAARLAAGEPVLLLDARERAEFEVSHLPGAVWIGPAGSQLASMEKFPVERSVVVYCSVGWRSALAARRLRELSSGRVESLGGGIFRWANEGRPLVDAGGRQTVAVHPYERSWRWMLRPPH